MKRPVSERIPEIGERIAAARLAKGITQTAMARTLGITNVCLCHIEKGKHGVSLTTFIAICEYPGTSADFLLFGRRS